jgi:type I restriction enzyme S subunit
VAEFLDRETGKIDAVVEKQETLLKQLEEKRAATISHAVTKGLDPNVPMKDSGVEWLGKVPEHWTVQRLKFLADGVTVGVVVQPSQYYADTGVPALRSLNLRPMGFDMTTLVYFDEASHETLSKSELREGDVVAVRTGKPGVAAPVTKAVAGSNCIDLILIRNAGGFDARFIAYVINSEVGKQQVALGSGGAIQQHFNIEEAANLLLASPDVKEQKLVADHLDRVTAKLDTLAAKARQNIALLRERRAALISAAVTGRIDVRGTAKASTEVGRAA